MECPNCGNDFTLDKEEIEEEIGPMLLTVDSDDAIDYIFTELIKKGYAPRSAEIYLILEYYQDFIDLQIKEYIKDGDNKNDDNNSL